VPDVLKGGMFKGGGKLPDAYGWIPDLGLLVIHPAEGYIWNFMTQFDANVRHFITFTVKTQGGEVFIELKNTDDVKVTPEKIKIVFPDTKGEFKTFTIDPKAYSLYDKKNTRAGVFAFSDPQGATLEFKDSIPFTPSMPNNSTLLTFDGRRFGVGLREAGTSQGDILTRINFVPGGNIEYKHDATLVLEDSQGWIWANMPETDLGENPELDITAKGRGMFWLELKNAAEAAIVGELKNGVYKIPVSVNGVTTVNLTKAFRAGVSDKKARIIALSDPEGTLEISGLSFKPAGASKAESPAAWSKLVPVSDLIGSEEDAVPKVAAPASSGNAVARPVRSPATAPISPRKSFTMFLRKRLPSWTECRCAKH